MERPKLICLTPVRNEAWCLDVFLKCTSSWADHIIIADQNSTDGSREIALKYPKVKLLVNVSDNYDENERQKMLISEARKIEGAKILVALDADEIFSANFMETNDWLEILNSQPGDVFGFQWANILPDKNSYFPSSFHFPWLFHDDGITEHKNYVRWMHSMRIPYPTKSDAFYYKVNDFKVLHFSWIDTRRFESKNRFYQCLVALKEPDVHFVTTFRSYHSAKAKSLPLEAEWLANYNVENRNILDLIDLSDSIFWFDLHVIDQFKIHGFDKFKNLDIWDDNWINKMKLHFEIIDPRPLKIRAIHSYLRLTNNYAKSLPVRFIDKILKTIT